MGDKYRKCRTNRAIICTFFYWDMIRTGLERKVVKPIQIGSFRPLPSTSEFAVLWFNGYFNPLKRLAAHIFYCSGYALQPLKKLSKAQVRTLNHNIITLSKTANKAFLFSSNIYPTLLLSSKKIFYLKCLINFKSLNSQQQAVCKSSASGILHSSFPFDQWNSSITGVAGCGTVTHMSWLF